MDIELSPEQDEFRRSVASSLERNSIESEDQMWSTYGELGWLGIGLPLDLGGGGGSLLDEVVLHRELGRYLDLVFPSGRYLQPDALMQVTLMNWQESSSMETPGFHCTLLELSGLKRANSDRGPGWSRFGIDTYRVSSDAY